MSVFLVLERSVNKKTRTKATDLFQRKREIRGSKGDYKDVLSPLCPLRSASGSVLATMKRLGVLYM